MQTAVIQIANPVNAPIMPMPLIVANDNQTIANNQEHALSMESFREAQFRRRVLDRLHEAQAVNQPLEAVFKQVAAEQQALATSITAATFIATAGTLLWQAKQTENKSYATTIPHEQGVIDQVLQRRALEAQTNAAHMNDPEYTGLLVKLLPNSAKPLTEQQKTPHLRALDAKAPYHDVAMAEALRDVKRKETRDDLLHIENGAPQVHAHIDAINDGMKREHSALAIMFAAEGPIHKVLHEGLAKQLPNLPAERIHALTLEWLSDREAAAKTTVEMLGPEGPAYLDALKISADYHAAKIAEAKAAPLAGSHAARAVASKSAADTLVMGI